LSRKGAISILRAIAEWVDTPTPLSEYLYGIGYEGDYGRFEPLDRLVLRTGFRSTDAIKALGLGVSPERLHYFIRHLDGWAGKTTARMIFGVQGRWWVKDGYEPGFVDYDPDSDGMELI
jgi:hypothetical protein